MNIKKEYTKGDLTIVWQPSLCIHSGVCFRSLPAVFQPLARPWVQLEGADLEATRNAVRACPSGALSIKADNPPEQTKPDATRVNVIPDGPVRVTGPCAVHMPDGSVLEKPNCISFCRCGKSSNLPFCDATHKTIGFKG